ncbi:hypothetical protein PMAYCL1PPCAC_22642, partial [Pristionchus mayeri]
GCEKTTARGRQYSETDERSERKNHLHLQGEFRDAQSLRQLTLDVLPAGIQMLHLLLQTIHVRNRMYS